jgi:tetratricopeptide (TPR) repeat protein
MKTATMRNKPLVVASITALLTFGACAQQQSQPVPDAPQPQKKPAAKAQPPDPESKPAAAKDDNAFPEAASEAAAKAATGSSDSSPANPQKPTTVDNPFPEAVSRDAAKAATGSSDSDPASPKNPAAKDNPFPESVSRDAAKAAGNDQSPAPTGKTDLPLGVSSSLSSEPEDVVANPARAKEDAQVGGFYLKSGDYQGALLRYKDATTADPTNVDAIFGLAETQRMLKKNGEAARNYQLYLDIVPNGPKAKQALKALKALGDQPRGDG